MDRPSAIAFLKASCRALACETDLSPNNLAVNQTLGTLVATLQRWQAIGFGADLVEEPALAEVVQRLPERDAKGGYRVAFARQCCRSAASWDT